MNEKYQEIYNYFKANKLTDLDANSFYQAYSDPSKSKEIWSYLKQNKMTDLDANAFHSSYFGVKKKGGSQSTLDQSNTSSARLSNTTTKPTASSSSKEKIYILPNNPGALYKKNGNHWSKKIGQNYIPIKLGDVSAREEILNQQAVVASQFDLDRMANYAPEVEQQLKATPIENKELKKSFEQKYGDIKVLEKETEQKRLKELQKPVPQEDKNLNWRYGAGKIFDFDNPDDIEAFKDISPSFYMDYYDSNGDAIGIMDADKMKAAEENMKKDFGEIEFKAYHSVGKIPSRDKLYSLGGDNAAKLLNNQFKGTNIRFYQDGSEIRIVSKLGDGINEEVLNEKTLDLSSPEFDKYVKSFVASNILKKSEKDKFNNASTIDDLVELVGTQPYKFSPALLEGIDIDSYYQNKRRVLEGELVRSKADSYEQDSKAFDKEIQEFNTQIKGGKMSNQEFDKKSAELEAKRKELESRRRVISNTVNEAEKIDKITNNLYKADIIDQEKKEQEGSFLGIIGRQFGQGLTNVSKMGVDFAAAAGSLFTNAETFANAVSPGSYQELKNLGYSDDEIKNETQKIIKSTGNKIIKDVPDLFGAGTTEEYVKSKDRGQIEQAVGSLAESIGTMAGGAALAPGSKLATNAAFFAMSYNAMEDQMRGPAFDGLSENEKKIISLPYGLIIGQLEKYGAKVGLSAADSPILNTFSKYVMSKVFTSLPKNASLLEIKSAIDKSVAASIANGMIKIVGAGLVEGGTEFTQQIFEGVEKDIANKIIQSNRLEAAGEEYDGKIPEEIVKQIKENDFFKDVSDLTTSEGISQLLSQSADAFKLGFLAGGIGGTVSVGIQDPISTKVSNNRFKIYKDLVTNDEARNGFIASINAKVESGKLTRVEADQQIKSIEDSYPVIMRIPDNLSTSAQREAFSLISEKDALERYIIGKDPALVAKQKDRINEINEQLKTTSYAVQEQTTSEVSVQPGTEVSREVEKGESKAGSQVIAEEVSKAKEEVDQYIADAGSEARIGSAINPLVEKMAAAENIDDADIDSAIETIFNEVDSLEKSDQYSPETKRSISEKLLNIADKLDNYEFRTTTETVETTKAGAATTTRKTSEAVQKINAERYFNGVTATVNGQEVTFTDNKRRVETTMPNGEVVVLDTPTISVVEDGFEFDDNGALEAVTVTDRLGNTVRFTGDTALDLAIRDRENKLGVVEQAEFETAYQEVKKNYVKEAPAAPAAPAVETTSPQVETTASPTVETYRAEEQAELLEAIPNIEDYKTDGEIDKALMPDDVLAKYNEIYNKYDKLISPLLETTSKVAPVSKMETTENELTERNVRTMSVKYKRNPIVRAAINVLKALPGIKIYLHEDTDQYSNALANKTGESKQSIQEEESAGSYIDGEIHLDMSRADLVTLLHEAVHHALLVNGIKGKYIIDMANGLRGIIKDKARLAELDKFVSQYKEETDQETLETRSDEFMAQLGGILAANQEELTTSGLTKFMALINRIFKKLGFGNVFTKASTAQDAVNFINAITRGLNVGEDVSGKYDPNTGKLRFQADFSDPLSKLTFVYDKNKDDFKKLEKDGYITYNNTIADFGGKYMFLHQPDAAFSGMIYKNGELLVEGKGGVYYPIKFHKDGYFWASTSNTAKKMAEDLNKVFKQNGGTIYMALTSAPSDKLMSSTTMSNAILDFFSSKAFDKNFKISQAQLKQALISAANDTKQKRTVNKETGKVSIKNVGLNLGIKPSTSISEIQSLIKAKLNPDNSSFGDRKNFAEELIKLMSDDIKNNPEAVNQFGKLFSEGIQNKYFKGVTKTGKLSISKANMVQAISEMFTEPLLKEGVNRESGGQVYAVIELNGPVKPVDSDKHESYPKAIQSDSDAKVIMHILQDRRRWSDVFEDFENDSDITKEREAKIFPTSGVSVRGLKVKSSVITAPTETTPASKRRKQIIGKNAELSDNTRRNLELAKAIEMTGADQNTIFVETGWFRGTDGKWKYEVPDELTFMRFAMSELKPKLKKGTMAEVSANQIIGKNLLLAYPQLSDIRFEFTSGEDRNYYNPVDNIIRLSIDDTNDEIYSTYVHEVQHAIQHIENFAKGGGKDTAGSTEKGIKATDRLNNATENAALKNPKLSRLDVKTASDYVSFLLDELMYEMSPKWRRENGYNGEISTVDRIKKFINSGEESFLQDNASVIELLDAAVYHHEVTGLRGYFKLAGEVESRNVEKRLKMGQEERKSIVPNSTEDVAAEDQILYFDKDTMKSIRKKQLTQNWVETPVKSMMNSPIAKNSDNLRSVAVDLVKGKINQGEYVDAVKKYSPIGSIGTLFAPSTMEHMIKALGKKADKLMAPVVDELGKKIKRVGLRLDIPSYLHNNAWIVTIHDGRVKNGNVVSYRNAARLKNVEFATDPRIAINIAAGFNPKGTFARMVGDMVDIPGETAEEQGLNAQAMVEEIMNDPNWVQVGMNPFRHSFFWNRATGAPVVSADEVIQIGGLVYAKNVKEASPNSDEFTVYGKYDESKNKVVASDEPLLDKSGKKIRFQKKAPNGQPSNLNDKQWEQVRTPAFKKWFGDWENDPKNASKVVDENGEPKVVYHGSMSEFDEFKKDELGKATGSESSLLGFYFSDNQEVSETYIGPVMNQLDPNLDGLQSALDKMTKKQLGQFDVDVLNYTDSSDNYGDTEEDLEYFRDDLFSVVRQDAEAYIFDSRRLLEKAEKFIRSNNIDPDFRAYPEGYIYPAFLNIRNPYTEDYKSHAWEYKPEFDEIFKNHDGAILENTLDSVPTDERDGGIESNVFIVFEPNQIKSATENVGTFSAETPKIKFQKTTPRQESQIKIYGEDFSDVFNKLGIPFEYLQDIKNRNIPDWLGGKNKKVTELRTSLLKSIENRLDLLQKDLEKQSRKITSSDSDLEFRKSLINKVTDKISSLEELRYSIEENLLSESDIEISIPKRKQQKAPKILGQKPTVVIVKDEAKALIDQIKLEVRAQREQKKAQTEVRKSISDSVKAMVKKGSISLKQASTIISTLNRVNLDNPEMVKRFNDYIAKVFDRAEYIDKVERATRMKKKIKANLKDASNPFAIAAKGFSQLEPKWVENIDDYIMIAQAVYDSVKKSTARKGVINWKQEADFQIVAEYVFDEEARQTEVLLGNLRSLYERITGKSSVGVDAEVMQTELKDLAVPEDFDADVLDQIEEKLAEFEQMVEDTDPEVVQKAASIDPTIISAKEAIRILDALDTYFMNGSLAGLNELMELYTGKENAIKFKYKAKPLRSFGSKKLAQTKFQNLTQFNMILERKFRTKEAALAYKKASGIQDIENGANKAEAQAMRKQKEYMTKFGKIKGFNSAENIFQRGALANLLRTMVASEEMQQAEFDRNIEILRNSVDTLSKGNANDQKKAKVYKKVLTQLGVFNPNVDIEMVLKNAKQENINAVNFVIDMFGEIVDPLSDLALGMYNQILTQDVNYTPYVYKMTDLNGSSNSKDYGTDKNGNPNLNFFGTSTYANQTFDKNKAGVLMPITRPKNLRAGMHIDLDFDNNMFRQYRNALVDLYTAGPIRRLDGFFNSEENRNILGSNEDQEIIYSALIDYIRTKKGSNFVTEDGLKFLNKISDYMAQFGAARALVGVGQFVNQFSSGMTNTIVNAGEYIRPGDFSKEMFDFMANSGRSIANVGGDEILIAMGDIDKSIERADLNNRPDQYVLKFIAKENMRLFNVMVAYPDAVARKLAWMAYYRKSMVEQGLLGFTESVDTTKLNDTAADYAQLMVDRNMDATDATLRGSLFRNRNASVKILRSIFMPFASFGINQKNRMWNDLNSLFSGKDIVTSGRSLASIASELVVYNAIRYYVAKTILGAALSILGYDDDDQEELYNKLLNNAKLSSFSKLFTDIISPLPLLDNQTLNLANKALKGSNLFKADPEAVQKYVDKLKAKGNLTDEEIEEKKLAFEEKNARSFYVDTEANIGTLGIQYEKAIELIDLVDAWNTGEYVDDNNNERFLSKESREKLTAPLMMKFAATVYGTRELDQIANKSFKLVKDAESMSKTQQENYKEVKKELGRDLTELERSIVKKKRTVETAIDEMKFIEKNGGLNKEQGSEYLKLLDVIPKPSPKMIVDIQNGKTAKDIIKKSTE